MKIYTKTGDKGKTSLFDGTRVRKDNIRVETYGTIDELNSILGVAIAEFQISNFKFQKHIVNLKTELIEIQNDLFDIGAILANPRKTTVVIPAPDQVEGKLRREYIQIKSRRQRSTLDSRFRGNDKESNENNEKEQTYFTNRVLELEQLIDEMTNELPELSNFILPGGGKTGALLHFARTVCRRVERRVISLSQEIEVQREIIIYFNRLSDLLFTMSRFVNFKDGEKEVLWEKNTE